MDDAPPPPARGPPIRVAIQNALLEHRPVFFDGGHGPEAYSDLERGFQEPVDRGCVRGLPLDGRALPRVLRVRDLAAQSRARDPHSQFRRTVPGLAAMALRA